MLTILLFFIEVICVYLLSKRLTQNIFRLFFRISTNRKISIYVYSLFFLPGTFIHEFSHFMVALLLLVPVGKMELMPEIENDKVKLGSVSIGKTDFVRRSLVGLAPTFVGVIVLILLSNYLFSPDFKVNIWTVIIIVYIIFEVGNTMFSSKKDLEGSLTLIFFLAVVAGLTYIADLYLGLDIHFSGITGQFSAVIEHIDALLGFAVVVDIIFLALVNTVDKIFFNR